MSLKTTNQTWGAHSLLEDRVLLDELSDLYFGPLLEVIVDLFGSVRLNPSSPETRGLLVV